MQEKKFHRESVEGVDAVFECMWEAVGRPLFTGYAQAFDVSESDIKNWRRRGRVSRAYLEGFSREHGVSLDWLLHGEAAPIQAPLSTGENLRPYGLSADEAVLLDRYRVSSAEVRAAALRMLGAVPPPPAKKRELKSGGAVEPVHAGSGVKVRKPARRGSGR